MSFFRSLLSVFIVLFFLGCAHTPGDSETGINDPIEGFNRGMFYFNDVVEGVLLRPLATIYVNVFPDFFRDSVGNVIRNVEMPITMANDLLQGDFDGAWDNTKRFVTNSVAGVGGIIDVYGGDYHKEDFGQTLAVWGVGDGFYLVLPLLGPGSLRDHVGGVVDVVFDPVFWVAQATDEPAISLIKTGVSTLQFYSEEMDTLAKIRKDALDYYVKIRSLYFQRRQNEIFDGDMQTDVESVDIPTSYYDGEFGTGKLVKENTDS